MKKKKIIIAIMTLIVIWVIAIWGFLLVTGISFMKYNQEKRLITAEQFKEIMESKEYTIYDITKQYPNFTMVYVAKNSTNNYQIEFYENDYTSESIQVYNSLVNDIESEKNESQNYSDMKFKNYAKHTLSANGKYMVVSRIENTVVYAEVDESFEDEVNNLLDEIGY